MSISFNLTDWTDNDPLVAGAGANVGEITFSRSNAYMRVKLGAGSADVARGSLVGIDATQGAALALTTTTAATVGRLARVGIALGTGSAGQYGWVQVYGKAPALTAGAVAVNAAVFTTATAGAIDDASTTGVLAGIRTPVATGAGVVEGAELNWPYLVSVA